MRLKVKRKQLKKEAMKLKIKAKQLQMEAMQLDTCKGTWEAMINGELHIYSIFFLHLMGGSPLFFLHFSVPLSHGAIYERYERYTDKP